MAGKLDIGQRGATRDLRRSNDHLGRLGGVVAAADLVEVDGDAGDRPTADRGGNHRGGASTQGRCDGDVRGLGVAAAAAAHRDPGDRSITGYDGRCARHPLVQPIAHPTL
ncbi:hypothetical protein N9A93_01485 [Akkermansiaceae bacterium]|nr:hypothetical protein [Akkermansiaceae bacterium]